MTEGVRMPMNLSGGFGKPMNGITDIGDGVMTPTVLNNMSAGKGDTKRPVNPKKYAQNYERIFGKKNKTKTKK